MCIPQDTGSVVNLVASSLCDRMGLKKRCQVSKLLVSDFHGRVIEISVIVKINIKMGDNERKISFLSTPELQGDQIKNFRSTVQSLRWLNSTFLKCDRVESSIYKTQA